MELTNPPAISPEVQAAIDRHQAGAAAGAAGAPLPADAAPQFAQGWRRGDVERRVIAGEVIAVGSPGSRCVKCKGTDFGHRGGCNCWPDGGWNFERNDREGYRMEWGALVLEIGDAGRQLVFMSLEDLRGAHAGGKPVVDMDSGEPVPLS